MNDTLRKSSDFDTLDFITNLFLLHNKNSEEGIWTIFHRKYMNCLKIISNTMYFKDYLRKLFDDSLDEGILIYQGRHLLGSIAHYETLFSEEIKFLDPTAEFKIIFEVLEEVKKREPLFEVNLILCAVPNWSLERIQT